MISILIHNLYLFCVNCVFPAITDGHLYFYRFVSVSKNWESTNNVGRTESQAVHGPFTSKLNNTIGDLLFFLFLWFPSSLFHMCFLVWFPEKSFWKNLKVKLNCEILPCQNIFSYLWRINCHFSYKTTYFFFWKKLDNLKNCSWWNYIFVFLFKYLLSVN